MCPFVIEMEIKPKDRNLLFRTGRVVDIEIESCGESRSHDLDDVYEPNDKKAAPKVVKTGMVSSEV
jgi:hypothetical protein